MLYGIFKIINELLHDFVVGLLLGCMLVHWVMIRDVTGQSSKEIITCAADACRRLGRWIIASLVFIMLTGIIRTITILYSPAVPLTPHQIHILYLIKHIILIPLVIFGLYAVYKSGKKLNIYIEKEK